MTIIGGGVMGLMTAYYAAPLNAPHLVALVRAGAIFRGGVLAERPEQAAA